MFGGFVDGIRLFAKGAGFKKVWDEGQRGMQMDGGFR